MSKVRKFVSLCLCFILLFSFFNSLDTKVSAITTNEIQQKLQTKMTTTGYKPGYAPPSSYTKGSGCYGFVDMLCRYLYNHGLPSQASNHYQFTGYSTNFTQIGSTLTISAGTLTESSLQTLFSQAKPGDVIQMDYTKYGGGDSLHTMMVYSVSSSGIVFYHAGSSKVYFGASSGTQPLWGTTGNVLTWAKLKAVLKSSDDGISLYRSKTVTSHTHSYTQYAESAHPHKTYKKCSCGDTYYTGATENRWLGSSYEAVHPHKVYRTCSCGYTEYTGDTSFNYSCSTCMSSRQPGKPSFLNLSTQHLENSNIIFSWSDTINTTHYNFYLFKKNAFGQWEVYEHSFYVSSGFVRNLPAGEYRCILQSYNSKYWREDKTDWLYTESDYKHFTVSHVYDNACDINCNLCGNIRTVSAHIYTNSCDKNCNECGKIRSVSSHNYEDCFDGYEQQSYGSWNINVTKTGVYTIKPSNTINDYSNHGIEIYDKNNNIVVYNETKQGWPLVENQEYTVKLKYFTVTYYNLNWQLTQIADTIFPDTSGGEWYNDAVTYVVGRGLMSGYGDTGYFGTADGIQRQDFLVMLARLDGVDLTKYSNKTSPFSDVPNNAGCYYKAAVIWGYENEIATGYSNSSKFGVGDKITREQIVTFMYRYAKHKGLDVSYSNSTKQNVSRTYTDFNYVTDYAIEPVLWAIENGVIKGKTSTTIVSYGNTQRCEIAQIMYNIFLNDIF